MLYRLPPVRHSFIFSQRNAAIADARGEAATSLRTRRSGSAQRRLHHFRFASSSAQMTTSAQTASSRASAATCAFSASARTRIAPAAGAAARPSALLKHSARSARAPLFYTSA